MANRFLLNTAALSGARLFVVFSQILIIPIIARYLSVEEFGDVALAMTPVLFAQLLSDAGLGRSLIRKPGVTGAEWSAVFWLLVAIGLGLLAAVAALAPAMVWLFERPTLGPLVAGLAVVPLLYAIAAVPSARMEREDQFQRIAAIRTGAAIFGFAVAVSMAVGGAGAWALVGQQLAIAGGQAVLTLWASPFRPLSPLKRAPLRDHLSFARDSLAVSFLLTAQRQFPLVVIGYAQAADAAGLFAMGRRILNLPQQALSAPMGQVAYVRMAASQDDPARLAEIYRATLVLLAVLLFPSLAVLAGIGPTAFAVLLSEPWREAGMIFALAAPGFAVEAVTASGGTMMQAVNATGLRLRMVFERVTLRCVAVALALPWGANGVALAISLFAIAYLWRNWWYVRRVCAFEPGEGVRLLARPAAIGFAGAAGAICVGGETEGWATILWCIPVALAALGAAAAAQRGPLRAALRTVRR